MDFEQQALSALAANRGKWYCPPCWGAVAGITSPEDLQKLSALARTVIEASNDLERVTTNKENAPVCTRYRRLAEIVYHVWKQECDYFTVVRHECARGGLHRGPASRPAKWG